MLSLIILILLSVFLYIWLKKIFARRFSEIQRDFTLRLKEYDKIRADNAKLKNDNNELKLTLEQTVALYNITKQICKHLEVAKVFSAFEEEISKYIRVHECMLIEGEIAPVLYKDYMVLPLKIDTEYLGYLVAKGVEEKDRDKFHILANQFLLGVKRSLLYQKVQELSIIDGLTGIWSRRYFLERFREELKRSKQFRHSFAFLMVDIDHFKEYNDRYGHLVGDVILREVARIIKDSLRQIDLICRYGGEEFSIILTETDKTGAMLAAERIRKSVETRHIHAYDEDLTVTISVGISVFPSQGRDTHKLIDKADQALYQAKQTGRNKVCVYQSGK
jgi:two-component system cell cycle response regulator